MSDNDTANATNPHARPSGKRNADRHERLAAALRANLRKRKAQGRARADRETSENSTDDSR